MSMIAIITARGGSKRIPKKNIKEFCGKPIIAYSIEAALDSGIFDELTPDRLSVRNYMIKKLEEMGMLDEHIVRIMIDHFFDIDPCSVEKNEYLKSRNEEKNGYE